jgi:hypothetical protein
MMRRGCLALPLDTSPSPLFFSWWMMKDRIHLPPVFVGPSATPFWQREREDTTNRRARARAMAWMTAKLCSFRFSSVRCLACLCYMFLPFFWWFYFLEEKGERVDPLIIFHPTSPEREVCIVTLCFWFCHPPYYILRPDRCLYTYAHTTSIFRPKRINEYLIWNRMDHRPTETIWAIIAARFFFIIRRCAPSRREFHWLLGGWWGERQTRENSFSLPRELQSTTNSMLCYVLYHCALGTRNRSTDWEWFCWRY